jgi:LEA14-like dessication related protein
MKKPLPLIPFRIFLLSLLLALSPGCKTPPPPPPPPPPQPEPSAALTFEGIDAAGIERVPMEFRLLLENPRAEPAAVTIEALNVEINGRQAEEGIRLTGGESARPFPVEGAKAPGTGAPLPASAAFPLRLELDLAALNEAGFSPVDDYQVQVSAALDFRYPSGPPVKAAALARAVFPRIRPPVFSITDIAVLQAELINTRFRVRLNVENPNPFPMELSAFRYQLYGSGRLWAGGSETRVLGIPARDSSEATLFLVMNFIGMKRELLDQVVAFQRVPYRFTGEAAVTTGIPWLPEFPWAFDLSGHSEVFE